jgi:IS5 family transposase
VLTLFADGAESLWDELLPEEVRVLPDDLARLDELLCDPELLVPIAIRWERELAEASRFSDRGRPSLAMETYVRLMVLKHRCGWGYETLMREVSDSIHLRRFCRLGLTERVPDESTVRKLTRRLGPEVVHQLSRELIQKARREKRFRPRAARIDSTVVEADVRYPTDSGLAADGVRALAREARKLAAKIGAKRTAVRDRSRAAGRRVRGITRTMRHRSGQAKQEVLKLTGQTGELLARSVKEARRLAAEARRRARGRGAQAKLKAARKLEQLADRCEKVVQQIKKRIAGEKITDRLVSLWDPDARPIRKGRLSTPNQFGYVDQLCEITANTKSQTSGSCFQICVLSRQFLFAGGLQKESTFGSMNGWIRRLRRPSFRGYSSRVAIGGRCRTGKCWWVSGRGSCSALTSRTRGCVTWRQWRSPRPGRRSGRWRSCSDSHASTSRACVPARPIAARRRCWRRGARPASCLRPSGAGR